MDQPECRHSQCLQPGLCALTDQVSALYGAEDSSISIGAVTVQPGGTGVLLAGTGDPNDALDSYYGAGLLRSTDGGNTWTLIPGTSMLPPVWPRWTTDSWAKGSLDSAGAR